MPTPLVMIFFQANFMGFYALLIYKQEYVIEYLGNDFYTKYGCTSLYPLNERCFFSWRDSRRKCQHRALCTTAKGGAL